MERAVKIGRKFQNPVPTELGGLSLALKVLPMYFTNRNEREPRVPLGPFRTDASVYKRAPESGLRVTWFGHSSSLLEVDGVRLLIDPVWDERAAPVQWFGPKRFFAPTLELKALPELDAVLISHDHYDHLGKGTVQALAAQRPGLRWVTSLGVGMELQAFGVARERITELDWTESVAVTGQGGKTLKVTSVPSRHFSGRSVSNRNETLWAAFVLAGEQHKVYYGADSGLWDGFTALGKEYGPFELTMLEIGAFNELWRDIHLGPDGAMDAFQQMGGGLMMPVHWGLFDLALHGWREPIERMVELSEQRGSALFVPEPGLPTEVVQGGQVRSNWWRPR